MYYEINIPCAIMGLRLLAYGNAECSMVRYLNMNSFVQLCGNAFEVISVEPNLFLFPMFADWQCLLFDIMSWLKLVTRDRADQHPTPIFLRFPWFPVHHGHNNHTENLFCVECCVEWCRYYSEERLEIYLNCFVHSAFIGINWNIMYWNPVNFCGRIGYVI